MTVAALRSRRSPKTPSGVADTRRIAASSVVGGPQRTRSTPRAASSLRPCAARVSTTPQGGGPMKPDSGATGGSRTLAPLGLLGDTLEEARLHDLKALVCPLGHLP